jgi:uncharacterized protein (DUF983 family)
LNSLSQIIKLGLQNKCPNCGQGKLLVGYLKQSEKCSNCNEDFSNIRADDAPPWLTILIVGHILAPFILHFLPNSSIPDWQHMIIWPSLALILSLLILPRAKGLFIALIWRSRRK